MSARTARRTAPAVLAATVLALAAAALLALAGTGLTAAARADGDPGSDVLVYTNLFFGSDANLSVRQQVQLGTLLDATTRARAPVRVAIIARPDDLGAIAGLWGKPALYARYLGYELSLAYKGRLLVVMPAGLAVDFDGAPDPAATQALAGIRVGPGATGLVSATQTGVRRLVADAGVSIGSLRDALAGAVAATRSASAPNGAVAPVPASTPTVTGAPSARPRSAPAGGDSGWLIGLGLVVAVSSPFWLPPAVRRAGSLRAAGRGLAHALEPLAARRWALPGAAVLALMAALATVAVIAGTGTSTTPAAYLATNPNLDPGTVYDAPAPNFTLTDQFGRTVSLHQFRGKVVILAFNDAECQTICPLTTTAMLDAKRSLGAAGSQVQLLGVDANAKSISIGDVLSYSQLHGLTTEWHYLTGSLPQLEAVWHRYRIEVEIQRGLITHTPALFLIDRHGRVRRVFITQSSYAAVPQLGQVLARDAAGLLPGRPAVHSDLSYAVVRGISPGRRASLPRPGGGHVVLGPGGAHLYVFFATWDQESTTIAGHLELLNRYVADATRDRGLAPLTAVDEGSVEPSPRALPAFLRTLGRPLRYPVAIDTTGRVADGYEVEGQPWFVLTTASGHIAWYQEIYASGWPTLRGLEADVRAALAKAPAGPAGRAAALVALRGSPAPLAALHIESSDLLGGEAALEARIRALRGYPIVLNAWASWCTACQSEFGYLARAAARYGKGVAFLGVDTDDASPQDAAAFLKQHFVSYPSYTAATEGSLDRIWAPGVIGLPTTLIISRAGKVVHVNDGAFASQGSLDQAIETYALARR